MMTDCLLQERTLTIQCTVEYKYKTNVNLDNDTDMCWFLTRYFFWLGFWTYLSIQHNHGYLNLQIQSHWAIITLFTVYSIYVAITIWSFPHSWLITAFVTRVTRRVSHVEQELLTYRSTWVHTLLLVGFLLFNL